MAAMLARAAIPRSAGFLRKISRRSAMRVTASTNANAESYEPPGFLEFAETVNGRAAMQGFVWGSVTEALTGKSIKDQLVSANPMGGFEIIPQDALAVTTIIALVVLGTAITSILPNEKLQVESGKLAGPFTNEAEKLNGRAAMIGFVLLACMN